MHSAKKMFLPIANKLNIVIESIEQSMAYIIGDVGIHFDKNTKASEGLA